VINKPDNNEQLVDMICHINTRRHAVQPRAATKK